MLLFGQIRCRYDWWRRIIKLKIKREEDELLDKQFQSGMSISDISKAHNRTYKAIRIRLQRHGLIDWNYKDK